MGASDSVEVQLLQQEDVLQHPLLGDGLSPPLVVLVAAHPLDQYRLVVMQQLLAFDLVPLEAHLQSMS